MKVWIDLANSPHPLLFAPIARRLEQEGATVLLTARDNAQTLELVRARWSQVQTIGGPSPGGRLPKAAAIACRMAALRDWARAVRPDVALSHNSYAQIVAARAAGIPVVTAMDFEHQPANHLAFRLAHTVLVPEALPVPALRRQGAGPAKLVRYPGLKEELYIGDFEPDPEILLRLGIERRPDTIVVARTPPSRAIYHTFGNPLFDEALRLLGAREDVLCVLLARHPEQVAAVQEIGMRNCLIPREAVDSRSLMYAADAMIGAGGTMTREAALMGIPTWTVFAGEPPAVDLWLQRQGMMSRLERADQVGALGPRSSGPRRPSSFRERGEVIGSAFLDATVAASARSSGSRCGHQAPA